MKCYLCEHFFCGLRVEIPEIPEIPIVGILGISGKLCNFVVEKNGIGMKKITIIFITFAIVLSSCVTQRGTPQRADNLPPVYVSLKNIFADNGLTDRGGVEIDGIPVRLQDSPDMKIDINNIRFTEFITVLPCHIFGNRGVLTLLIETKSVPPPRRRGQSISGQISLKSLLADNDLCENCPVVIDGVIADELTTRIDINAITAVMIASDALLRSGGIERDCILIIRTR